MKNPNTRKRQTEDWRKPDPAYPYMNNLRADIRLVGGPTILTPFTQHNSASRLDMFRSHLSQAVIVDGAEFPKIFTGKEMDFARYEMQAGAAEREQNGHVVAVIPKYPVRTTGINQIHKNPTRTVIYIGEDDNKLHCFDVTTYFQGADGFGYKNNFSNEHMLFPDTFLPKDAIISRSPARKGNQYNLGVNANVAYLSDTDTIEDAMTISRSLARRFQSLEVHTTTISVRSSEHPINHFGDDIESKFLPDIGERVGADGILCAFRPVNTQTFAADMNPSYMRDIQSIHDRIIRVKPGSEIVDINFYPTNKRDQIPWSVYGQVEKYQEAIKTYWAKIIAVYEEYGQKHKPSPRFNTLVTKALLHSAGHGERIPVKGVSPKKVRFLNKSDHPVEFLHIEVTYVVERKIENGKGFKISDRTGTKGVICRVVEDDDMPIDDFGIRADLIIDPGSVNARMNIGQLCEQGLNRVSEFVRRKVEGTFQANPDAAVALLFDYYNDINPNYADLVKGVKNTKDKQYAHVTKVIQEGIHLNVPPFLNVFYDDEAFGRALARLSETDSKKAEELKQAKRVKGRLKKAENYEENIWLYLMRKWEVPVSPVTYTVRGDAGPTRSFRTEKPVVIGEKYVYLLSKIPEPAAPGVSHVSHHGIPMKTPAEAKMGSEISTNPTRFGEDEIRIFTTDVSGQEILRLMSLQSSSPTGVNLAINEILNSDYPTRIKRFNISTEALRDTNAVLGLFTHIMTTQGIDAMNTRVTKSEMARYKDPVKPVTVEHKEIDDGKSKK